MEKDGIPYEVVIERYYYDYDDDTEPTSDFDDYEYPPEYEDIFFNQTNINEKSPKMSQVWRYEYKMER